MTSTAPPRTRRDPEFWPCGRCGAEPGQPCRTGTGNRAPVHVDRLQSVQRWERYGRTAELAAAWDCWAAR